MERQPALHRVVPVLLLAASAVLSAPAAALERSADPVAAFDTYAEEARRAWRVPGLAVAVVDGGEVVLARGYGVRDLDASAPEGSGSAVDEDTLFAIGSTTKAMTAALLGQLAAVGELSWDDPVIDHLPAFRLKDPYATREVTIRDLLTHRAGLGNADLLWYGADRSWEEIFPKLAGIEPAYSLRDGFVYQNLMYAVAGHLAARVAGSPWESLMEDRLFEPLGMERTVPTLARTAARDNVAAPHHEIEGEIRRIDNEPVDPVAPAGAVWSSAAELSRWVRMLLAEGAWEGGRVLPEETVAELFRPQTLIPREAFYPTAELTDPHWTSYGLGWFQQDYRGLMVQFHTGSIDGMSAIVGLVPEEELGVVVLANLDHAELRHALLWKALDLFTGSAKSGTESGAEEERDWSAEVRELYAERERRAEEAEAARDERRVDGTSPSLALERYAGRYTHPLYDRVEVRRDGAGLRLVAGARRTADLEHWHFDTFRARWDREWQGSTMVTFGLDETGAPGRLWVMGTAFEREDGDE
ncbi:MAG: serine hydrolase [Acidobacteriota bacterium]